MKTLLLLPALLIFSTLSAQTRTEENGDTTRIVLKNRVIEIIEDSQTGRDRVTITPMPNELIDKTDGNEGGGDDEDRGSSFGVEALGVDLGANLFFHENSLNFPAELEPLDTRTFNSANVTLHALGFRIGMAKNHVNLCTAVSFDFMQMAFSNPTVLIPGQDSLSWFTDTVSSYRKNKLNVTYLQAPLMLRFETKPGSNHKNFRFAFGGYYGIRIGSFTKTKTESGDKQVTRDDFNLNKMRYGVTARIGYGGIEFFANYNLSPLFREDQGPEVSPLTLGVGINTPW